MNPIPKENIIEEVEKIISTGKPVELKVEGKSMRPYLRSGKDVIVLFPCHPGDLKRGDIVLFCYENNYIFHRIIRIENDKLLIQGDGVINRYETALKSDVIGIVQQIIRPDGKRVSTHGLSSEIYWRCWLFLHPFRHLLLAFYDSPSRFFHRIAASFLPQHSYRAG